MVLIPLFSIFYIVPSGKMLSSSPSSNMHLIVPSGKLKSMSKVQIYLHNFLGLIWEMFFYLVVWEFKYLKLVWESCLCCLCFSKIINNLLVWECLFDVCIVKIDYCVSIWPWLSFDSVIENHFLLSTCVNTLYLSIVTYNLINNLWICKRFGMIFFWELQSKVFFLLLCGSIGDSITHDIIVLWIVWLDLLLLTLLLPIAVDDFVLDMLLLSLALLVILKLLLFLIYLVDSLIIDLLSIHVFFFCILNMLLILVILFHILLRNRTTKVIATLILLLEGVSVLALSSVARYFALHLRVACCSRLWPF